MSAVAATNRSAAIMTIIRILDSDREGSWLYAGKNPVNPNTWRWYRLTDEDWFKDHLTVGRYQEVRECDGNQAARLNQKFNTGSFRLLNCALKGDTEKVVALISK